MMAAANPQSGRAVRSGQLAMALRKPGGTAARLAQGGYLRSICARSPASDALQAALIADAAVEERHRCCKCFGGFGFFGGVSVFCFFGFCFVFLFFLFF